MVVAAAIDDLYYFINNFFRGVGVTVWMIGKCSGSSAWNLHTTGN